MTMRISTSEFLLGSLPELLAQQSNVNTLNQEIATGQTMLSAASDPAGAGLAMQTAGQIQQLTFDANNAAAGTQTIQTTLGALEQVSTLLDQLQQVALNGASAATSSDTRQSLVVEAQNVLQQLVQLGNTQGADGNYVFAGSKSTTAPFAAGPGGQIGFNGDAATNSVEIAPGVSVPVSVSGQGVFVNLPAGQNGITITAGAGNTGGATALVQSVTNVSQIAAESVAGTQYEITFTGAGSGGNLNYTVASGTGSPGTAGFTATSGTIASGSVAANGDLQFAGMDVAISGTPATGDSFAVQPGTQSSLFQTVQNLITAIGDAAPNDPTSAAAQQQIQNAIGSIAGAQTSVLTAEASLGAGMSEIQAVQNQDQTETTAAKTQLSNLQSANLPQVISNFSASVTALQAAEETIAHIQNLSLFSFIQ